MLNIRPALRGDIPNFKQIYLHAIEERKVSLDSSFAEDDKLETWFNSHQNERFPLFAICEDDEVVGFSSISPFRGGRKSLADIAEISIYLESQTQGKGYGSVVLEHIAQQCKTLKFRVLIAVIIATNNSSIKLFERHGYSQYGKLPQLVTIGDEQIDWFFYAKYL